MNGPVQYLLDTNVVSETRKKRADPGVISFLEAADASSLFISVLTLGEIHKGVAKKWREDPAAAVQLVSWVDGLEFSFSNRILGIDAATARLWGKLSSERPRPVVDTLLAATAMTHGLTLVTRNIRDIHDIQIQVLDPWRQDAK